MKKMVKHEYKGLDREKKDLLKKLMGSASSETIDFNKVRDEWKYGNN